MPRSGDSEAGLVSQDPGTWRLSIDSSVSLGLEGGHPETHGISPSGKVIEITPHDHEVELDLYRVEFGISRTLSESWDLALRVPYLVREQTASVAFRDGTPEAHRQAARRNGQIHHRTETYTGFSDLELTAGWRTKNLPLLGENSVFRFSLGTTIPVGETEDDPWVRGDNGLEHLHIQFGNGTFDPVLDAYLGAPINKHFAWGIYTKARLPVYRNHHGYRGSPEVTFVPRLTWLPSKNTSVTLGATALYYGYSSWDSGRDRNSGQFSALANFGIGYKVSKNLTASASVLIPFYTDSFSSEDALDPAPTFSLSLGFTF